MRFLYKRTRTTIKKWGDIVVERIKKHLRAEKNVASSRTINSTEGQFKAQGDFITYSILSRTAGNSGQTVLEILNEGRKPGRKPPMQAILYWMEQKGIQPRGRSGKYKKTSDSNMRAAAYNIARAIGERGTIKKHGYRGNEVLNWAFQPVEKQIVDEVATSFEQDLTDYIDKKYNKPRIGRR